jgi:SAM-dependent methyltransferase
MEDQEIKARLVCAYNDEAALRDGRAIRAWEAEELGAFMARLRAAGCTRLLDLGAGPGRDGLAFQRESLRVVSIDLASAMVRLCHAKGLPCAVADFYALPFVDAAFDAAWALNCLLHVPKAHLLRVLTEIARVLKPGALFCLGVYRGDHDGIRLNDTLTPPRYFAFYQPDELCRAVARAFTIESLVERELDNGVGHLSLIVRRP